MVHNILLNMADMWVHQNSTWVRLFILSNAMMPRGLSRTPSMTLLPVRQLLVAQSCMVSPILFLMAIQWHNYIVCCYKTTELKCSGRELQEGEENCSSSVAANGLHHFQYSHPQLVLTVKRHLEGTNFTGITVDFVAIVLLSAVSNTKLL